MHFAWVTVFAWFTLSLTSIGNRMFAHSVYNDSHDNYHHHCWCVICVTLNENLTL